MDKRLTILNAWLETILEEPLMTLEPASSDASFRRYFRARTTTASYVVMDAPPDKEPLDSFIAIDKALERQNVHAPAIIKQNHDDGFLLLEDLGNRIYLDELHNNPDVLYADAISALIKIQLGTFEQSEFYLPTYDRPFLQQEMNLFDEWYLQRHLNINMTDLQRQLWQTTTELLVQNCLEQPQVWVHRDFHSRNLMVSDNNSPAVIDFQDMLLGPISYDLASLFKDCYIKWPKTNQHRWLGQYLSQARRQLPIPDLNQDQLIRWVDLTALQRHLKVLGIFCRLNYRDGKANYMGDLPLVKTYIAETLDSYPELADFSNLFKRLHENAS